MKKIRIALLLVLSIVVFNLQAQIQKKQSEVAVAGTPEITFKEKSHDFGTIEEGEIVETVFEFANTGNAPLIISKIKASCGCTVPSNWSKEPIQPGEESSFSVKFNSSNKPNRQSKTITVNSNAKKGADHVTIKLFVTPDPEKEALRLAQAAKRKEHYRLLKEKAAEKEKLADQQLVKKNDVAKNSVADHKKDGNTITKIEKERKKAEDATKKMSQEREKTKKEIKNLEKERKRIEKETKKLEKENDKAEKVKSAEDKKLKKAAKKAAKEEKAAAKKAKKLAKQAVKIEKASNAVSERESKIAKLAAKMKKTETQGDLSPNEKLDYENKIGKLTSKLEKEKKVLAKLQNK